MRVDLEVTIWMAAPATTRTPPTIHPGKNVTTDTLLSKSKSSNRTLLSFFSFFYLFFLQPVFYQFFVLFLFLVSVFKECPHPDEKQRLELSRRLCLETRQVKFWFQNRRTQMKVIEELHHFGF